MYACGRMARTEPDYWHAGVVDWTGILQGAGGVGIATYLGIHASPPLEVAFDDFLAMTTDVMP